MRIYEMPYYIYESIIVYQRRPEGLSVFESIWLVLMTIFTVGYGDISPNTEFGKVIATLSAIWGAFLVSLNVLVVNNFFQLTLPQERAKNHI